MAFAQSDAGAAAILVEELDAACFQCARDYFNCGSTRFAESGFELADCHNADPGPIRELLLRPIEEPTRGPALRGSDHERNLA
jgi:hypothetical protein